MCLISGITVAVGIKSSKARTGGEGGGAGLEKTRLKKKTSPVGFLGFFCFFFSFFGFFGFFWFFFLYICPEERVFRVFQLQEYF